jgi:hypothetical protein
MKTAVLLSGHMRSFERCLPTLHWHVFRHLGEVDFFVSTVADADAPKAELLRAKYPKSRVEIDVVPEQPDCVAEMRSKGVSLPDRWQPPPGHPKHGEVRRKDIDYFYTHEPYAISVHPQAVLRQLWQLEQVWKLLCREKHFIEYDAIVRCRPDLWFHSFAIPDFGCRIHQQGGEDFELPSRAPKTNGAYVPWWGQFGGVNDRFALMGPVAAASYFQTYSSIKMRTEMGCPIHPESLIAAALSDHVVRPMLADFSTLRSNGEMRAPEITSSDLAHLALTR